MRKVLFLLVSITNIASAGVITHSDYVGGNTITAAGQNANENLIFNEFNGNIDNTNIKAGGILGTNIANATITGTQIAASTVAISNLNAVVISTITSLQNQFAYRRPNLVWKSNTTVSLETGLDGNSGEAAIIYPSGNLVTETNATALTMDITRNSGNSQGGLLSGSATANTWYAVYAIRGPNITLIATLTTPIQASSSTLDSAFGHNNWVYLGMIRYGDNSGATTVILNFTQAGNTTLFTTITTGNAFNSNGIRLATTASAASLTYTYSAGTGAAQIPGHINLAYYGAFGNGGVASSVVTIQPGAGNGNNIFVGFPSSIGFGASFCRPASDGVKYAQSNASAAMDIYLEGFVDGVLGIGSNPQL